MEFVILTEENSEQNGVAWDLHSRTHLKAQRPVMSRWSTS